MSILVPMRLGVSGLAGASRRRVVVVLALLAGLLGATLLLAGPAAAHASLVTSDPVDGSRLAALPKAVMLTFDEAVGLGYLHVTDSQGRRVDSAAATHPGGNPKVVSVALEGGATRGSFTASFRVVSADSHPVAGAVSFVVGDGALVRASVAGTSADPDVAAALGVTRWITLAGLALLGGVWLILLVWAPGRDDRVARRTVWIGWAAMAGAAAAELVLEGAYSAGTGLASVFSLDAIDSTLHTGYGQAHSLRLVVLGVLAVFLGRALQPGAGRTVRDVALGGLGVVLAWTVSASGHATTTSPVWLSQALDVAHLLAMAAWLGGLMVLVVAVLPRGEPSEARAVVPVFSRVAFGCVVVLATTGTYAAWRGVGSVGALVTTGYGRLVVIKVLVFVGLVALGNVSRGLVRRWSRRPVAYAMTDTAVLEAPPASDVLAVDRPEEDGPDDAVVTERLRRSVILELILGVAVLALTAVLVGRPRGPEAIAARDREPVSATAPLSAGRTLTLTVDPGVHGQVTLTVDASTGVALPARARITATATQASAQIGPLPVRLVHRAGGGFDGTVTLPVAGRWRFDLVVTTSAFDATATDATLDLN